MERFSLLVVGCGDLGGAVAAHFAGLGWPVVGVRRHWQHPLPGVQAISADVTDPGSLAPLGTLAPTHVLLALSPGGYTDARYEAVFVDGLRHCLAQLNTSKLQRLVWVSSTSVFHQDDGDLVDESSPVAPTGFGGRRLWEAEQQLAASGLPASVVRLGGIYGPGRGRLLRELKAGRRSPAHPQRFSNRIHRDDAVAMLQFLLQRAAEGVPLHDLYLGVDNEPTPIDEVERWFANYLGLNYDALAVSDEILARGGSRRCSNARLRATGFEFLYPSFRAGLPTLLQE